MNILILFCLPVTCMNKFAINENWMLVGIRQCRKSWFFGQKEISGVLRWVDTIYLEDNSSSVRHQLYPSGQKETSLNFLHLKVCLFLCYFVSWIFFTIEISKENTSHRKSFNFETAFMFPSTSLGCLWYYNHDSPNEYFFPKRT